MEHTESIDWQMARSNVYGLLGSLLSIPPTDEAIRQLSRPRAAESIKGLFDDPPLVEKMDHLAERYRSGNLSTEVVAVDFEGLMRVPGAYYTHPYESNYSGRNQNGARRKWNSVLGRQAREVERRYREEGLEPRYDRIDFADHIGAELTFMAHICRKTAEAMLAQRYDESERLLTKQRQFAKTHLLSWAGDFSEELAKKAETPFFQTVAALLSAFLRLEQEEPTVH
jgi:TorA maturation chaperone TorD